MIFTQAYPKYFISMKRSLIALLLFGLFPLFSFAQFTQAVTLTLTPDSTPCTNDEFCVDVTTDDWTTINKIETFFSWNPDVIEFVRVDNINTGELPTLDESDFNTDGVAEGVIYLNWDDLSCDEEETLDDDIRIFSLCFRAKGRFGASTQVYIPRDTTFVPGGDFLPKAIKKTSCNSPEANAGLRFENGVVSTCVDPVQIIAESKTAFEDEQVCVSYTVSGFTDILGMQFSINWNPDQLRYVSHVNTEELDNLGPGSFGDPLSLGEPGNFTLQWLSPGIISNQGVTVEDGTPIFEICYDVVGECETTAPITFSNNPTKIELIVNDDQEEEIDIASFTVPGQVNIGRCEPTGLRLVAECQEDVIRNLNEQFCVSITSDNFENISRVQHVIEWNENILTFTGIENVEGIIEASSPFDFTNTDNGILGFDFNFVLPGNGTNIPPGKLYDVCFEVTGLGGDSPFNFRGSPTLLAQQGGSNQNFGINPSSCNIRVNQPNGVTMLLPEVEGRPGDIVCMDVEVNNFTDIINSDFTIGWETTIARISEVQRVNLPGANVLENQGFIAVEWSGDPISLDDGSTLLTFCLEIVGEPGECDSEVGLRPIPRDENIITSTSNGEHIGLEEQPGEVCVLFPEGFFLDIGTASGFIADTVCVPVKVANFENITRAKFDLTWGADLFYAGIQNLTPDLADFTGANFVVGSTPVGLLEVDWANPAGESLADSTTLFEVCFEPIGEPDQCYPIEMNDQTIVNLLNGIDGDIVADPGEICVEDRLLVESIVRNVTCPGGDDGEIELFVSGGRRPYLFNWQLAPPQFDSLANNLTEGMKIVTVFDNSRPEPLIYQDTFMIGVSDNVPIADAGPDVMLTCESSAQFARLEGNSVQGPQYEQFRYRWAPLDIGGAIQGEDTLATVVALSPGEYLFEVTNRETGCFSRDTVAVTANLPIANAGPNADFTCETGTFRLNGSESSTGNEFAYEWTTIDGSLLPDQETMLSPQANAPGTYVLKVTNTDEGCVATDTVVVNDLREEVIADAGPDMTLGCVGDTLILNPQNVDGALDFQWFDGEGILLANGSQYTTIDTGNFILTVTDETTGCQGSDTVRVTREIRELPIEAEALSVINCIKDTASVRVILPPDVGPVGILWEPVGDGIVVEDAEFQEAKVGRAGEYQVTVFNPENNCSNSTTVTVTETIESPVVEAGDPVTLDCENSTVVLNGQGSAVGPEFTYRWLRGDTSEVSNRMEYEVLVPGVYYLEVTNNGNGCVAKDSVAIDVISDIPTIEINPPTDVIDCNNDQVEITALDPNLPDYDLEWVALGDTGNIVSSINELTITVDAPGTYQVLVLDNTNQCVGFNEVIVEGNLNNPRVDAGDTQFLTCERSEVVLRGEGFSNDEMAEVSYSWRALDGGSLDSPADRDSVVVSQVGAYELAVTDLSNGCFAADTVMVEADTELPVINFEVLGGSLGCGDTLVTIDATSSIRGNNISVDWTGIDNNDTWRLTANQLIIDVVDPGRYELVLINEDSGCRTQDTISISEEIPEIDIVFANDTPVEGCPDPNVLLDATPTVIDVEFETRWTPLDQGNSVEVDTLNPLLATANGVGDYELFITLGGNCAFRDTITVLPNINAPIATVVESQIELECGETAVLDGTGSSEGPEFSIQWVNATTNTPLAGGNALVTSTMEQGLYQLIITNINSTCTDTAEVDVTLNTEGLPTANAGQDETLCENETILSAEDPGTMATGLWTTSSGATIESPDFNASIVSNLQPGTNVFVWTLSAEGCNNYAADSVRIIVSEPPNATDDLFEISAADDQVTLNLVENDNLGSAANISIDILSSPSLGDLINIDTTGGSVIYAPKEGLSGRDIFSYVVCNVACANLCDTANVDVLIEEVEFPGVDSLSLPNGITPNGDGLNDELYFEIIDDFPGNFPDNHMIIFNRWGDIVFEARPYTNDWRGTNDAGQDLPAGTYYYILRLNLADGIIFRGDVTIVR